MTDAALAGATMLIERWPGMPLSLIVLVSVSSHGSAAAVIARHASSTRCNGGVLAGPSETNSRSISGNGRLALG
jgi:hypothetical protein